MGERIPVKALILSDYLNSGEILNLQEEILHLAFHLGLRTISQLQLRHETYSLVQLTQHSLQFSQLVGSFVRDHLLFPPDLQLVQILSLFEGLNSIYPEHFYKPASIIVLLDVSAVPDGDAKSELSLSSVDFLAKDIEFDESEQAGAKVLAIVEQSLEVGFTVFQQFCLIFGQERTNQTVIDWDRTVALLLHSLVQNAQTNAGFFQIPSQLPHLINQAAKTKSDALFFPIHTMSTDCKLHPVLHQGQDLLIISWFMDLHLGIIVADQHFSDSLFSGCSFSLHLSVVLHQNVVPTAKTGV